MYEVTIRTIQERFLCRPGDESRDIVHGVIGRAQELYPSVSLYNFSFLSNHPHSMMSALDAPSFSGFLGFVHGNVARELGRLHGWRGPFWGARSKVIRILDDDAIVARHRYITAQGCKEGLVASPRDWPGASALAGLLGDMTVEGTWYSRDIETRARRRGVEPTGYARPMRVQLAPIPPWAQHSRRALREAHEEMVRDIERETSAQIQSSRRAPLGPAACKAMNPHARPSQSKHGQAPLCHTTSSWLRRAFADAYRLFVSTCRDATAAMTRGDEAVFPPGCYPGHAPAVPSWPGALEEAIASVAPG